MKKHYFGTDGIRGKVGGDLINPEFVERLGVAFGRYLGGTGKVLIGHDTRESAAMLETALIAGLSAENVEFQLLGAMPSPAVAYLTKKMEADAGIVISASHNKFHDNGIKFFSKNGFKLSDEEELAIEEAINSAEKKEYTISPARERRDKNGGDGVSHVLTDGEAERHYIQFCKDSVSETADFSGLTVVLDCANGATAHVGPHVLRELNMNVIEMAVAPNGKNINQDCGATSPESLQKKALEEKADAGIAFDGDGDRIIMVDEKGEVLDGDDILFILSQHAFQKNASKKGVVGTLMTNMGLEQTLKSQDILFERAKVGDRHVMARLQQLGWTLGGETSGHIINLERTTTGDGLMTALHVLEILSQADKTLSELRAGFQKYPQVLLNVPISANFNLENDALRDAVKCAEKQLEDKGRVLLRASGTEPVVRVMVEGQNFETVSSIAKQLADTVCDMA